jgi:L-asparaginase II
MHQRPLAEYLDPASPLQRRIEAGLRRLAPGAELARGTDGCSAPNYAMPLAAMARLFCRLACGDTDELAAIRFAMARHPDLVSGTGRADLRLMQAGRGDWVAKAGALGVQGLGISSLGLGIVVRIADGDPAALRVATLAVLEQLGLPGGNKHLKDFAPGVILNDRGLEVGKIEARFGLE